MTDRTIQIIGVPMDLGQRRRGVDMGPSVLRYAGLGDALRELGYRVVDRGNLAVPLAEHELPGDANARHLRAVAGVCADIHVAARDLQASDDVTIFLGGDHSLSIGTIAAMSEADVQLGVLWIDAHGDFNTPETTPSGNIHGMSLAALLGRFLHQQLGLGGDGGVGGRLVEAGQVSGHGADIGIRHLRQLLHHRRHGACRHAVVLGVAMAQVAVKLVVAPRHGRA